MDLTRLLARAPAPRPRKPRTVHDLPLGVPFRLQPGGTAYRRVWSPDGRVWLRDIGRGYLVLCMMPFPVFPLDPEPEPEAD